jgi:hypothetical protein
MNRASAACVDTGLKPSDSWRAARNADRREGGETTKPRRTAGSIVLENDPT